MMPLITRFAPAAALALGLCAVASCAGDSQEPTVTIMIPWSAKSDPGEYNAFMAVISQFERESRVNVVPESTTGITQQLDADLAAGEPPDLADLPSPGAVRQYEQNPQYEVNGKSPLQPIPVSLSSYDQPWRGLAEWKGAVYAVPVKADVKSLIWYQPSALGSPPATWTALQDITRRIRAPWCLGLASGSTSGWPGADWVADILLSQSGAAAYENWLTGSLPWTSVQVSDAWEAWGTLIRDGSALRGGAFQALKTSYNSAMAAGCLEHGALSATGLNSASGYNYVRFPSISGAPAPVLVSGDFMVMFARDDPNATMLLNYLASAPAQELWVHQFDGHAFSANNEVKPGRYPEAAERTIARLLQPGTGSTLCFSGEDIMAPDMSAAFEQAVLDYIYEPNALLGPHGLLAGLQKTRNGIPANQQSGESQVAGNACARA